MKKENALNRIRKRVKPENKIFVRLNVDIVNQVRFILKNHKDIKTQKALAESLDKEESEISRSLSGLHNLTLETIAKLTAVLGEDIIMTDLKAKEKYLNANKPDTQFICLPIYMDKGKIRSFKGSEMFKAEKVSNISSIPLEPQKTTA